MAFRSVLLVVVLAFLAGVVVGAAAEDGEGRRLLRALKLEGCPGFAVKTPPVSAEHVRAVEISGTIDHDCSPVVVRVETTLVDGSVCVRTDGRIEPLCGA